jgi:DNA-binding CsgD family transcriptional regulator
MHCQNANILAAVLDTLNVAVFVLDGDRKPLHANAKARALIREGRPFHLDQVGSLRITEASEDKALKESVGLLRGRVAAGPMRVLPVRGDGARSGMFAWISGLPMQAARGPGETGISVMITGRSFNTVGRKVLADLFGLTQAESRLVQCLLQGISPGQYAIRQDLSPNTVRNQLKSVFEKTDVRRQSDLINLIWNVLAPLSFDAAQD